MGIASTRSPRERIAAELGDVTGTGSFSARRSAPTDDLSLEVRGVGPVRLPVSAAQARQLRKVARLARYGHGEQTLMNREVRDTWEIPRSRVRIDKRRWNRTLRPMLDKLGVDLALAAGTRLTAELHSMLLYAPGQFFVPHQDSEKTDDMVASLVVTLPGEFTGGSLLVHHHGTTAAYRSAKTALSFVAFYADCRHEIRPVRSGHRIVLTYNLLLRGEPDVDAPPESVDALTGLLREHFVTPPAPRWRDAPTRPPDRLVYLLDHEYTQQGLGWRKLKGDDAARVAALCAAAEQADCDVALALADLQETWDAIPPDGPGRWYDDDYDDDPWLDDADPDCFELGDLLDSSLTLDHCVRTSGEPADPIVAHVDADEVCATTPSAQLAPYAAEYEGYMGNYGNTIDRWYRRAAVVVWPTERAFIVHAEASAGWALRRLHERIAAGDRAAARTLAKTLIPFWDNTVHAENSASAVTSALGVAVGIDDPPLAATLVRPLRLETLTARQMPALAGLAEHYGRSWTAELLDAWFAAPRSWLPTSATDRAGWVTSLPTLCEALPAGGQPTAGALLTRAWAWLDEALTDARGLPAPSRREKQLGGLVAPLLGFLAAVAAVNLADLAEAVVAALCGEDTDALLPTLVQVLRQAPGTVPGHVRSTAGLDALASHCRRRLWERLGQPPRTADDWSITALDGCGCEICAKLDAFLTDPAQRELGWPLAKPGRAHVHHRIDGAELPIRHQTRRSGRPYTLVLTKTDELFGRETGSRRRDQADLDWLNAQPWSAGRDGSA
jgi:predicted 2-oxoglutarate/Fe(II)-dependent dioxygenase YbiX